MSIIILILIILFRILAQKYIKISSNKKKKDIKENKITDENIPIMFQKQYPILKFMDMNELLDKDDDYDTYKSLYNDMYPEVEKTTKHIFLYFKVNKWR